MKSIVVPTLLAAVVAAAVSVYVVRRGDGPPTVSNGESADARAIAALAKLLASYKKNPPSTTLTLAKDGNGNCKAEVDSDPVGNLNEKKVFWYVINQDCDLKEAHPKIKLVFTPNRAGQYPFPNQEVPSKRQNDLVYVHEKIKKYGTNANEANYGLYKYAVYLLNGTNTDPGVPVLDPDLEVEDGNRNITAAPGTAGSATAPPVKQ